jgi:hypothetical protein
MNHDLRFRLAAFADELAGPLGQIPFDRAIRGHLSVFSELRAAGCTWTQIANALAGIGIRRSDGGAMSGDQIRGAVSRQVRRVTATAESLPGIAAVQLHTSQRSAVELGPQAKSQPIARVAEERASSGGSDRALILSKLERAKRLRE